MDLARLLNWKTRELLSIDKVDQLLHVQFAVLLPTAATYQLAQLAQLDQSSTFPASHQRGDFPLFCEHALVLLLREVASDVFLKEDRAVVRECNHHLLLFFL